MKKKLSIVLSLILTVMLLSTASVYGAKKIKSKSVTLSPKTVTINVDGIEQLKAKMNPVNSTDSLKWTSSNEEVATVTTTGVVTGISEGESIITVKTTSKKTATCTVKIKDYVTKAEVTDLVKNNVLKDSSVIDMIKKTLSGEFVTKTDAQAMIDKSIAGISTGGGSAGVTRSEAISLIQEYGGCDCSKELSSSGKVPLHSGQKRTFTDGTNTYTVNDVDITKSKFDDIHEGAFYAYKYDVKITGTTNAEDLYGETYFTNKFGAKEVFELYGPGRFENVSIDDGAFTVDTVYYGEINASELIIRYIGISD